MALRCDMFVPFQLIGEFCSASNSYQQFYLFFSLDFPFVSCPFQAPHRLILATWRKDCRTLRAKGYAESHVDFFWSCVDRRVRGRFGCCLSYAFLYDATRKRQEHR